MLPALGLLLMYAVIIGIFYDQLFFTDSVDLGWHWILTEYISEGRFFPGRFDPVIFVMTYYPPLAHALAAMLGYLVGSNLIALHLVTLIALVVTFTVIERGLRGLTPLETLAGLVLFLIGAFLLSRRSLLLGHEIIHNFFYSQVVGTALCLGCLWVAISIASRRVRSVFALGALWVLSYTYNLSAVHFACGFVFFEFCEIAKDRSKRGDFRCYLTLAAICAVLGVSLIVPHTFKFMVSNSFNDGGISARIAPTTVAIVAVLTTAMALVVGIRDANARLISPSARFIAAASAGFATTALVQYGAHRLFGLGSGYAVLKSSFGLATLSLCLVILLFRALALRRFLSALSMPDMASVAGFKTIVSVMFVILTSAILIRNATPIDLRSLADYDRSIRHFIERRSIEDLVNNTISANEEFSIGLNFSVAMGNLGMEDPMRVDQFRAFGWSDLPSAAVARYAFVGSKQISKFDSKCRVDALGSAVLIFRSCWPRQ